jgi:hypothetical protein
MSQAFAENASRSSEEPGAGQQNALETLTLQIPISSVSRYETRVSPISSPNDVEQAYTVEAPLKQPGFIVLLSGKLSDFRRFSGDEKAGWLMDIAYDICD